MDVFNLCLVNIKYTQKINFLHLFAIFSFSFYIFKWGILISDVFWQMTALACKYLIASLSSYWVIP